LVKAAPFLRGQRAENRMVEQADSGPESPLGLGEHRIHGDQGVVKAVQRLVGGFLTRHGMLRGFDSLRELANCEDVKAAQPLQKIRRAALGLARLHGSQQSLGGGGVGEQEVLKDLC
jgi:hypothetical protein